MIGNVLVTNAYELQRVHVEKRRMSLYLRELFFVQGDQHYYCCGEESMPEVHQEQLKAWRRPVVNLKVEVKPFSR